MNFLDSEKIKEVLASTLSLSDEPHGDPGLVNSFLWRLHQVLLKVGIAGDGGDELFAGYEPFSAMPYSNLFDKFPPLSAIAKMLLPLIPDNDDYLSLKFKLKAFLQGFPSDPSIRLPLWLGTEEMTNLAKLVRRKGDEFFSTDARPNTILEPYNFLFQSEGKNSNLQNYLNFYQKIFLPEFVCMHTDRAFMQNSLEVRAPFLSPELIKFANSLPDNFKLRGKTKSGY